jgi:hypothetical protein
VTEKLPEYGNVSSPHESNIHNAFELETVPETYIAEIINHMNINKASGDDDISCHILKVAMPAILESLT